MGSIRTGSSRGQSEVLGIVLLFALVIGVSMTVVLAGGQALNDAKSDTSSESASFTMEELQSVAYSGSSAGSAERISFAQSGGGSDVRAADGSMQIDESESVTVDESAGHITVEVMNTSTGNPTPYGYDYDLGAIKYQQGGETLAFQGGGVFRQTTGSDQSAIVSPPQFGYQYQDGTPTLSMEITRISTSPERVSGESFSVRNRNSTRLFPNNDVPNPLEEDHSINITIESRYYEGWAQIFRDRTEGTVHMNDPDGDGIGTASLTLNGPPEPTGPVTSAFVSGGSGEITNVGKIDSYDSQDDPYPTGVTYPHRENGDVTVTQDLDLTSDPSIAGDLHVAGEFVATNDPTIYGDTVIGGTPGAGNPTDFDSGGQFDGSFSTQDDLDVARSAGTDFGDRVIVGGDLRSFGAGTVDGSVHVRGEIQEFTANDVDGSIHANGDVHLDHFSDPVDVKGDVVTSGDVYVGNSVEFTGSDSTIIAGGDVIIKENANYDVDIVAGGNVEVGKSGDSPTLQGNIDAGGDVYVRGDVTGRIYATGSINGGSDPSWSENASPLVPTSPHLPTPETPVVSSADTVEDDINAYSSLLNPTHNDNEGGPISAIEDGPSDCSPCTLNAGKYGLDELRVTGDEELTLDTTGGDIEIYVDNGIELREKVDIVGQGEVTIYNNGDLSLGGDAVEVTIPGDDSTQLRIYQHPDRSVSNWGDPLFTGVIFGPGGSDPGAEVTLTNGVEIRGAIVGDLSQMNSHPTIHYDEALQYILTGDSGETTASGDTVGYLQISTRTVEVKD